jgi:hypothetical protein
MGTTEEEDTLAVLMVTDTADRNVPLTHANHVQNEMATLECWLICGATASPDGIDDKDGNIDDEGERDEDGQGVGDGDGPSSVPVPDSMPMPIPWALSNSNKSMPPSTVPLASSDNTTVQPW